jgi:hypothetical protein
MKYNILYKGRKIYKELTYDECADVLQDFSEKYFAGEDIDPNLIEIEESNYGSKEQSEN